MLLKFYTKKNAIPEVIFSSLTNESNVPNYICNTPYTLYIAKCGAFWLFDMTPSKTRG